MNTEFKRGDVVTVVTDGMDRNALFLGYHQGMGVVQAIINNERIYAKPTEIRFQSDKRARGVVNG